jgi:hypothetical protein
VCVCVCDDDDDEMSRDSSLPPAAAAARCCVCVTLCQPSHPSLVAESVQCALITDRDEKKRRDEKAKTG